MGALETVRSIYEAFGRGDVPAVLACLAEDVEWEYGTGGSTVPWLQPRRGHDGALGVCRTCVLASCRAHVAHLFRPILAGSAHYRLRIGRKTWSHMGAKSIKAPKSDKLLAFFDSLQHMGLQVFRPKQILAAGNTVVGLIDIEFEVPHTGHRVVEEDEVHIWHFDASGKVSRFRHRADTLAHERAWKP